MRSNELSNNTVTRVTVLLRKNCYNIKYIMSASIKY